MEDRMKVEELLNKDLLETWVKKGDVLILQCPDLQYDEAITLRDEVGRIFASRGMPVVILNERIQVDLNKVNWTKEELIKRIEILCGLAQISGMKNEEIDEVLRSVELWEKKEIVGGEENAKRREG